MIRHFLCWLGWHEWKYIPLREWEKLLKKGHKGHLMLKCKHKGKEMTKKDRTIIYENIITIESIWLAKEIKAIDEIIKILVKEKEKLERYK